jgi:hypothetical protein
MRLWLRTAFAAGVISLSRSYALAVDRLVPSQYATVQAAISACNSGDVVIIAPGSYTGSGSRRIDFLGKAITVRSSNPDDPNVVAATKIDAGMAGGRVFYFHTGEGPGSLLSGLTITGGLDVTGGGIYCTNSSSPTITKCVITKCMASSGGGVGLENGSNPTLIQCAITQNTAVVAGGGGMFVSNGSPTVTRCVFNQNWGPSLNGGAILCVNKSSPNIVECTFTRNQAVFGGAAMNDASTPTISQCTFVGNIGVHGGAIDNTGGGNVTIAGCTFCGNSSTWGGAVDDWACSATITNCTFNGNWSDGAALVNFGGSSLTISNCVFSGNRGMTSAGGGLASADSNATINKCTFVGNSSDYGAGGIVCADSNVIISDSVLAGNSTLGEGGALSDLGASTVILRNCTIVNNCAGGTGSSLCFLGNAATMVNSVLWESTPPGGTGVFVPGTAPTTLAISYCDVRGGPNAVLCGPNSILNWGTGNLNLDPCFLGGASGTWTSAGLYDPNTGRMVLTDSSASWTGGSLTGKLINPDVAGPAGIMLYITGNTDQTVTVLADANAVRKGASWVAAGARYQLYDFHLSFSSPCIDAGDPNGQYAGRTDIDGQPRLLGRGVDMGSDEVALPRLILTIINASLGNVLLDPEPNDANRPEYALRTPVTLTAAPDEGRYFGGWTVYDPNYPGDANRAANDANTSITIVMNGDRQVDATFKCSSGIAPVLFLIVGALGLFALMGRHGRVGATDSRAPPRGAAPS